MRKALWVGISSRVMAIVADALQLAEAGMAAEIDQEVDVALEKP